MSQVIRISDELYKRLEAYASGFDSPSNVIENILSEYEKLKPSLKLTSDPIKQLKMQPADSLDIHYYAGSEDLFKQQLLKEKKAFIKLNYTDSTSEIKEWKAFRFGHSSSVDGNLRSGYLRGWRKRGIYRAELSINREEIA